MAPAIQIMSFKSHEEHQLLISNCVNDIHNELDKILKVLVEDRSYGSKKGPASGQQSSLDLPYLKKLFDQLLSVSSAIQVENHEASLLSNGKKKLNKALNNYPCGYINVEVVASVALRLLRINSSSSPKQVRADKKLYDDLIEIHLNELHCLAWKVISFLWKNLEIGAMCGFEGELSTLTCDQIKSDLKNKGFLGKGSERALEQLSQLIRTTSSKGQVFVSEIIRSGIIVDLSNKLTSNFGNILRSSSSNTERKDHFKIKRTKQDDESDQKRLESGQKSISTELSTSFNTLRLTFIALEASQTCFKPQEHVNVTENCLNAIVTLLQCQHNFQFIPEIVEGEYLRILIEFLGNSLISFQPAYLPPFLPSAMRILGLISGRRDGSSLAARRVLIQMDLLIHPRRLGPVHFRVPSEEVSKVFERPEQVNTIELGNEDVNYKEMDTVDVNAVECTLVQNANIIPHKTVEQYIVIEQAIIEDEIISPIKIEAQMVIEKTITPIPSEIPTKRTAVAAKSVTDTEEDEDLPQIVDSGPDDN